MCLVYHSTHNHPSWLLLFYCIKLFSCWIVIAQSLNCLYTDLQTATWSMFVTNRNLGTDAILGSLAVQCGGVACLIYVIRNARLTSRHFNFPSSKLNVSSLTLPKQLLDPSSLSSTEGAHVVLFNSVSSLTLHKQLLDLSL